MKVSKFSIKNFRSVGPKGIILNFSSNLTALIGKNNVGKSNILKAIDLILGNYWPRETNFAIDDFYERNINNDIEICAYFDKPLEHSVKIGYMDYKAKIYGLKLEYKTYKRDCLGGKKGELHLEFNCIKDDGSVVLIPSKPPQKGERLKFDSPLAMKKSIKEMCTASIFIPVERDIFKNSPSNYRSLLGVLIRKVREKFLDSKDKIKIDEDLAKILGVSPDLTRRELFEKYLDKANEILRTEELIKISKTIEKYVVEHVGKHEAKNLKFDFQMQDSWNQYKNIILSMEHNDLMLPADRLGQGFQSLIVIAIFRTYLEINEQNAIFLIEEPEMFLHTHAKKYFYSILQRVANSGTQIIYSTHATEFVDIINYKNVKRIAIEDKMTNLYPQKDIDIDFREDEVLKLNSAINNERAELYFAEKVVLIEGETEKLVYDFLLKLAGIEPNLFNISIIETSGKGSMNRYIKLLQNFSIPFVAIYDSDILAKTGDSLKDKEIEVNNKDAEVKNNVIQEVTEDKNCLAMLSPYFELVAGITDDKNKKRDSKPINALKYFQKFSTIEDVKKKCPDIIKPLEFILQKNS